MAHPNSKKAKQAKAARKARQSTPEDVEQREAELTERSERQERVAARKAMLARKSKIKSLALKIGFVVFVVGGITLVILSRPEVDGVEKLGNDGRGHVANASYETSTPTSGAHRAQSPRCGIYTTPLELDLAVHSLEHGTVILWYNQDQPELATELAAATRQWDSHVIISPSAELDSPIVATAWRRRMSFDAVTEVVTEFVDVYRRRGPESVACDF